MFRSPEFESTVVRVLGNLVMQTANFLRIRIAAMINLCDPLNLHRLGLPATRSSAWLAQEKYRHQISDLQRNLQVVRLAAAKP